MNGNHLFQKSAAGLALVLYLLVLGFFAFRPFRPIPGRLKKSDTALEANYRDVLSMRRALMQSGRLTLEAKLQTASAGQGGPARIVTYSRGTMSRNFTLGQSGNALVFRLRTTSAEHSGQYRSLLVPQVFDEQRVQHLAVTFDGSRVRLYVDAQPHPATFGLGGDFSGWGRNHRLVFGDEPAGGRAWEGTLHHVAIYDRALAAEEIAALYGGQPVAGAVFRSGQNMRPLRYRNLFVSVDAAAYHLDDCLANIFGFVPLAGLVFLVFSARLKKMKRARLLELFVLLGLVLSGIFEFAQRGIAGRVPTLLDLAYNTFGAGLGALLLDFVRFRGKRGESYENHHCG